MLFIGGVFDGQRKTIPPPTMRAYSSMVHTYAYNPSDSPVKAVADLNAAVGITTHSYRIERLNDGHGNYYEVAVDPKVTNILESLIKGYHYHRRDAGLRGCRRTRY